MYNEEYSWDNDFDGESKKETSTNITVYITEDGILNIIGTGDLPDWDPDYDEYRWDKYEINSIVIGDGITGIGSLYFYKCKMSSVIMPSSVKKIKSGAFDSCINLKEIDIPNSVSIIGDNAFINCNSLTSVSIPDSVKNIGSHAFMMCRELQSITIPQSIRSIKSQTFSECNELTSINIPNTVKTIEYMAFSNCESLTTISIPQSVKIIDEGAFSCCFNLIEIKVEWKEPIAISDDIFSINPNCTLIVPAGSKNLYNKAIGWKDFGRIVEEESSSSDFIIKNNVLIHYFGNKNHVIIPEGVKEIGEEAFYNCNISSITIPSSVKKIPTNAFIGTTLQSFLINEDHPDYSSVDGVLYNKEKTVLLLCPIEKKDQINIPNSVKRIEQRAFASCTKQSYLSTGDFVTEIEANAFCCSSFTSIEIGRSVKKIGNGAFQNCDKIVSITIQGLIESINPYTFIHCRNLMQITIPNSVKNIGEYAFCHCESLAEVSIPNLVSTIGNRSFYFCTNLESVIIGESVINIGERSFDICRNLSNVILLCATPPNIEDNTFSMRSNLCTFITPKETKDTYKGSIHWEKFDIIESIQ